MATKVAAMAAVQAAPGRTDRAPDRHWLNAERVRGYSWLVVAIFGLILIAWIGLSLPDLVDPRGKPFGYDFMAYWSAARLALAGHPAIAFEETVISAVQHMAVPSLPGIIFPWHYPPTFLLPILPLGLLPYAAALTVFLLITAAPWAALVRRILPDRRAWIVAAAVPAGLINLLDGQNAFLTASLAGFALIWLDRRPVAAGVLIGMLAIKPHLAVLFPLALLAEGRWRTIGAAALTVAALCAASLVAFGWQTWAAFLDHLPVSQAMADAGAVPWGTMPTPFVFALSLGAPVRAAWGLQAAAALFAAGCVWRAWRRPDAAFEAKAATLVAGSLLVSPYLFYYDLLWAALAVGWLAKLGLRGGFFRGERETYLFVWLAPVLMPPVQMLTHVQLGFPALLLLLLAAVRRAAAPTDGERAALRRTVAALRDGHWLTRERVMRCGVGLALMSAVAVTGWELLHSTAGLSDGAGHELGNDFVLFWSSAHLAAHGQANLVYEPAWFQAFERALTGPSASYRIYVYPPTALLLSLPLALFSFVPGLIAWFLLGLGACVALLRRIVGWRMAIVAMVGAPPAFLNLLTGQNGYFTAALFAGGLMALDRAPVFAGICLGCLAYKPQLAVLLPFALAADRRWHAFAATAGTAIALVVGSVVIFGGGTWTAFLDHIGLQSHLLEYYSGFWHRMPTVFVALRVLGAAVPVAYFIQLLSAIAAAVAVVTVWRSSAPIGIKAAAVAIATFLATPHAWDYDAVVLIVAAAWLGREGMQTGFLPWERVGIVTLVAWPILTMALTKLAGVQIAPVVLWLLLLLPVRRALAMPRAVAAIPSGVAGMAT